jgi:UDP-N-acetylglucosamine acyltransferase
VARTVHPTAIVDAAAELGEDVQVGPFCRVGPGVRLGAGTELESHVVISGDTMVGERNRFAPFSVIGGPPQDLKFKGEKTRLRIGAGNVFRESATVNCGTEGGGGETRIGDRNFFMAYVHIAHDCRIGDGVIMANAATLAGHVTVMDGATVGAFSGVHQFCRIGPAAFIGGYSVITQDALPYVLTVGNRAESHGINVVGLRRKGATPETIAALRRTYRTVFRSKLPRAEGLRQAEEKDGSVPEVATLLAFVRASERGVIG